MSDKKTVKRGSGCLLFCIIFFTLNFVGSISGLQKEGALKCAILSFFMAALLLTKYFFPTSGRKSDEPSNNSYSSYGDDDDDPYTSEDMDDIFNEWENGDH